MTIDMVRGAETRGVYLYLDRRIFSSTNDMHNLNAFLSAAPPNAACQYIRAITSDGRDSSWRLHKAARLTTLRAGRGKGGGRPTGPVTYVTGIGRIEQAERQDSEQDAEQDSEQKSQLGVRPVSHPPRSLPVPLLSLSCLHLALSVREEVHLTVRACDRRQLGGDDTRKSSDDASLDAQEPPGDHNGQGTATRYRMRVMYDGVLPAQEAPGLACLPCLAYACHALMLPFPPQGRVPLNKPISPTSVAATRTLRDAA